jgi:hypothetical protein
MKKQLITAIACAGLLTAGSLAMAGQPSPNAAEGRANAAQGKENAGKPSPRAAEKANNGSAKAKVKSEQSKAPPKVRIAHCGCNYDGSGLEWKHIRVSTRAVGHLNHTEGSEVTCINDLEEEVYYTRGFADCRISEGVDANNIGGLLDCDPEPDVQTSCTAEEAEEEAEE